MKIFFTGPGSGYLDYLHDRLEATGHFDITLFKGGSEAAFREAAEKADIIYHHCSNFYVSEKTRLFVERMINDTPLRMKAEARVDEKLSFDKWVAFDKRLCNRLALEHDFPMPKQYSMEEMRVKFESGEAIAFPLVFKNTESNNGWSVFFIDRREQLAIIFDKDKVAAARARYPHYDFDKMSYAFEQFVTTPSKYYTKYRVVFHGMGAIHVHSVLEYGSSKEADVVRSIRTPDSGWVYHDPSSPLYLASVHRQSNAMGHDRLIPLSCAKGPKNLEEREILAAHGLDREHPKVPAELLVLAEKVARVFAREGMIGFQGQDWLQDPAGRFHLIECNLTPSPSSFLAVGTDKLTENVRILSLLSSEAGKVEDPAGGKACAGAGVR